jgi:hypothetical protein
VAASASRGNSICSSTAASLLGTSTGSTNATPPSTARCTSGATRAARGCSSWTPA